jgi:hypothetical protein
MESNQLRPALYADGMAGISHPVSSSLDLLFRMGVHLTTDTVVDWFFSTTLGLRYNLP